MHFTIMQSWTWTGPNKNLSSVLPLKARNVARVTKIDINGQSKVVNHGPSQQSSKEEHRPWKWGATARYYTSLPKTMLPTRKSVPRSSRNRTTRRPPDHCKETQTAVVWSRLPFIKSGGKDIMQGTVKGGRRQGRQRKRWEDKVREWTGLEFAKSQRAVENREKGGNWLRNHVWCPKDHHG